MRFANAEVLVSIAGNTISVIQRRRSFSCLADGMTRGFFNASPFKGVCGRANIREKGVDPCLE
jgi:hypothetical protein